VSLLGLEACQSLVEKETSLAVEALKKGSFQTTDFLEELARSLIDRKK
jgi:hypothetical protein